MSSGIEEMEVEEGYRRVQDFRYALRKFRNHNENFTIPAKFLYAQFFAMIAKFTMHSEIHPPLILIQTTSFCIIPILSLM